MSDHEDDEGGGMQEQQQQHEDEGQGGGAAVAKTGKKRYRRDKPWDHDGIDHWKVRHIKMHS